MEKNWCKLLLDSDKAILGYFNDLKNYHKKSHGNHVNSYATCLILKDYASELEKFISNHKDKYIYFKKKLRDILIYFLKF